MGSEGQGRTREGEYPVTVDEMITSPLCVYQVIDVLGKGTFGQVLKCWRKDTSEVVALKILKNLPSYTKQGQLEIEILSRLSSVSAQDYNIVQAFESFSYHGHICISFELLQTNLYDYLKQNRFQPLPLKHIRPIAQQVLTCLDKLQELGLVHSDVKPENIMLVDQEQWPFRVKVIDFGSGTPRSDGHATSYLQSRYYRAPEVILSLAYSEAIDMWSLGCVLAELFLGWPLFPGSNEYDQISFICSMLGPPPHAMLRNIRKASKFFNFSQRSSQWTLKTRQQVKQELGIVSKETRKYILASLSDLTRVSHHGNGETGLTYELDCLQFIALLRTMLTFDPRLRATPSQVLQCPYITMQHLSLHTSSLSVREWIQCMHVCCLSRTTNSSPPTHSTPPRPHTLTTHTLPSSHFAIPHPLAYHLAPSALAYLPHHTTSHRHQSVAPQTAVDSDTGYVSADSSPAARTNMEEQETPYFFPLEPTPYHAHTLHLPLHPLPLPLHTLPLPLSTPHELYTLYLQQAALPPPSSSLPTLPTPLPHYHTIRGLAHPYLTPHPFSRL